MKSPMTRLLVLLVLLWVLLFGFRLIPPETMGAMMPQVSQRVADSLRHALYMPYFRIGDIPITPVFLLKGIVFVLFLTLLAGMTRRFLREQVLTRTSMDQGQRYAGARVTGYAVFLVGLAIGLQSAGVNLTACCWWAAQWAWASASASRASPTISSPA